MIIVCDKCNGSGSSEILSWDGRRFVCRKCKGVGKIGDEVQEERNEEEKLLIWVKSLIKVFVIHVVVIPWSAEGGCGSCSHHGYKFRDITNKSGRDFKLYELQLLESRVKHGSPLQVALSECIRSKIVS